MLGKRANGINVPMAAGTIYFGESATKSGDAHWRIAAGSGQSAALTQKPLAINSAHRILKRDAVMAKSTMPPKKRTRKNARAEAAAEPIASVVRRIIADESPVPADWPENWATDLIKRVLAWQIEQMEMKPSNNTTIAAVRARDARTMTELVRTLEKLDAVNRRRESKTRKTKPRDDKAIKEQFIRRLDQLLAARGEGAPAGKPEPG